MKIATLHGKWQMGNIPCEKIHITIHHNHYICWQGELLPPINLLLSPHKTYKFSISSL